MTTAGDEGLNHCLYFTANSFVRTINRLAEEEFRFIGLAPSCAFIQRIANQSPGITQNEIAARMNLAPSTVTRFIDQLQERGLIQRETQGKVSRIAPTAKGLEMQADIEKAWGALYARYAAVMGEERLQHLAKDICQANRMFEK